MISSAHHIIVFSGLLGLAWAIFLFTHRRGNILANRFLGLLASSLSVLVLRQLAGDDVSPIYLYLYFVSHGTIFLIGPSLYIYVRHLIGDPLAQPVYLHFISFGVVSIFMTVLFYFRNSISGAADTNLVKFVSFTLIIVQVMHLLLYLVMTRQRILNYERNLARRNPSIIRIRLKWMNRLLIIIGILAFIILLMYLLIITGGYYQINNAADFLFLILLSFTILSIVVQSWRQPEIISGIYQNGAKYQNSPLTFSQLDHLKSRLERLKYADQYFLIQELTLKDLAAKLETPPYVLSQVINQEYGQSFFNFLNTRRIDYAITKMQGGYLGNATLESLAYDSGFNSKSTFNRAFKKNMGCTPSAYAKRLS